MIMSFFTAVMYTILILRPKPTDHDWHFKFFRGQEFLVNSQHQGLFISRLFIQDIFLRFITGVSHFMQWSNPQTLTNTAALIISRIWASFYGTTFQCQFLQCMSSVSALMQIYRISMKTSKHHLHIHALFMLITYKLRRCDSKHIHAGTYIHTPVTT